MEFLFPVVVLAPLAILVALVVSAGQMVAAHEPHELPDAHAPETESWTEEVERFDRMLSTGPRDPGFRDGT
ncbi:MAG: hypothetical protein OXN16_06810 [Gammaproteobacteria bacterium]|nr:hypothetical protein [Gammaproteobacteria bacterium]MDE0280779.1 hypothetical protein [Gammaproteobacteria bacterium]